MVSKNVNPEMVVFIVMGAIAHARVMVVQK
jgi:hypothetical protein